MAAPETTEDAVRRSACIRERQRGTMFNKLDAKLIEARKRFWQAQDGADMARAIEEVPGLSSPEFHRMLRRSAQGGRFSPNALERYNGLFFLLHQRTYAQQLRDDPGIVTTASQPWSPPFFVQIMQACQGRKLLSPELRRRHPSDVPGIVDDMVRCFGVTASLPPYEAVPGLRFALHVVQCPRCGDHRFLPWARYVDLATARRSLSEDDLLALNSGGCPTCRARGICSWATWIVEPPARRDPLLELCCVWRVSNERILLQPPPGTVRREASDVFLETRLASLIDEHPSGEPAPGERSLYIAYSPEELRTVYRQQASGRGLRNRLVEHLAHELREGRASVAEIEASARLQASWFLSGSDCEFELHMDGQDPAREFACAVVNEAIVELRDSDPETRAIVASNTADAYCHLDQIALAEQAMARAHDFAARVPDPAKRQWLDQLLAISDAAIAKRAGRFKESADHLERAARNAIDRDTIVGRAAAINARTLRANLAYRQGDLEYAVREYSECMELYQALLAEPALAEPDQRGYRDHLTHLVSGAWSNYGTALTLCADALEQSTAHAELSDVLEALFGPPVTPTALRERAFELFQRALAMSEPLGSWRFMITQAHNAGEVLVALGRSDEALHFMNVAARELGRVPGHPRTSDIYAFLARAAQDHGDGPGALAHWTRIVHNEMRSVLEHAGERSEGHENFIINAVLRTTQIGGDPAAAILLVESLRGLATAASVARGLPMAGKAADPSPVTSDLIGLRNRLVEEREALRTQRTTRRDTLAAERLASVERELASVRRDIALRDPALARWTSAFGIEPCDLGAARSALARVGPNTLLLGTIPDAQGHVWVYALGEQLAAIRRFPRPRWNSGDAPREQMDLLGRGLLDSIADILDALGPAGHIVFTGPPNLPLAGLLFRGRPLCTHVTISYVQSLGLLLAILDRPGFALQSAVLIGNPTRSDTTYLGGAHHEVSALTRLFDERAIALVGAKATVPALVAAGPRDVVHFACHASRPGPVPTRGATHQRDVTVPGHVSPPDPGHGWGRLLLAPADNGDSGELSEDRIIEELPVKLGAFVNLAACGTAALQHRAGFVEGGLVSAFLAAGARSVLATAWSISDRLAARFQLEFYAHMLAGKTPVVSLVETQRACISGSLGAEMQEPEAWAGYHLFGTG